MLPATAPEQLVLGLGLGLFISMAFQWLLARLGAGQPPAEYPEEAEAVMPQMH